MQITFELPISDNACMSLVVTIAAQAVKSNSRRRMLQWIQLHCLEHMKQILCYMMEGKPDEDITHRAVQFT